MNLLTILKDNAAIYQPFVSQSRNKLAM